MAAAVKISDVEMEAVREAAKINSRSIAGQAEHWMRIGRAVESNPRYGYAQIEEALRGLRPVNSLSDAQQEEFFDSFAADTLVPSPQAQAFWQARQTAGLGVGMDDEGNIIRPN